MDTVKIYALSQCDTCRRALKWLREHHIPFEEKAIRETPPTAAELRVMLKAYDGELKKLFNTAGQDYRAMKLADKLPAMSVEDALQQLASKGNLVKRPFLIGRDIAVVGFDPTAWAKILAG